MTRPTVPPLSQWRRAAIPASLVACFLIAAIPGCGAWGNEPTPLVIATPWLPKVRAACEAVYRSEGGTRPILWVELGSHRWADACDRRGGVDLILGGPARLFQKLADAGRLVPIDATDPVPWRQVERPGSPQTPFEANRAVDRRQDPRDDPATFAEAKALIEVEGWAKGYEALVRRPIELIHRPNPVRVVSKISLEAVALARTGRHADQARRFLTALTSQGMITATASDADLDARSDDLLADLLSAALVDAHDERRDAQTALEVNGHPTFADSAVGDPPPWPPASVMKLRADPGRVTLLNSLEEQIAPDPEALDWLKASWREPKRSIDLASLREISQASGGRLVREPRFRAWLRGEWTAWTQQLYRRVARLAGGYRPS